MENVCLQSRCDVSVGVIPDARTAMLSHVMRAMGITSDPNGLLLSVVNFSKVVACLR